LRIEERGSNGRRDSRSIVLGIHAIKQQSRVRRHYAPPGKAQFCDSSAAFTL
jgi:hypothetical protein